MIRSQRYITIKTNHDNMSKILRLIMITSQRYITTRLIMITSQVKDILPQDTNNHDNKSKIYYHKTNHDNKSKIYYH